MFVDIAEKLPQRTPSIWRNSPYFFAYIRILCELLEDVNTNHYEKLQRALILFLPPPSEPAIAAFLNDIFDDEQRGIQVSSEIEIIGGVLTKANILVYLPSVILGNSFFPSDISYIRVLLKNLTRLGLGEASSEIFTGFTLYFNDGTEDFTFYFENGTQNNTLYFNEILTSRR